MYAIIETGSKQYKVEIGDVIDVELLPGNHGDEIIFDKVMMCADEDKVTVGTPLVENATVVAEMVKHYRGKKVVAFKMKKRKGYRRKIGHRQEITQVTITKILSSEKTPATEEPTAVKEAPATEEATKE
ncbi:MAG: 50S ribosomal protein L21 [Verrucomicrobiota bacterium]|nr:50S ribosomal protein L21 [Verrucomicrobiota bacterium]